MVYCHTYAFLNEFHQIYESQYSFRSKHLCEHAIQELTGSVLKGMENNKYTLAVFLDLSKAFDTIVHKVLFDKLDMYGIRGNCLDWFVSYLSDRKMRVKCVGDDGNIAVSPCRIIEFGTPQGSVLGPLIFLIFNNDLHLHLSYSNCILFADDTTIYATHRDLRHLTWCIWEDLETISDWFKANKLTLNLDKSNCILFQKNKNKQTAKSLCISTIGIPQADHTKFLGVFLDEHLDWTYQFKHVVFTIKRNMNLLMRSQHLLNIPAKKNIYYGHIYSHLSYCISTWGPMLKDAQIKSLQKLQNKCINLVDQSRTNLNTKYQNLCILKIKEIIDLKLCKIGFHLLHRELPTKLLACISTNENSESLKKSHGYQTRHKKLLNLPKVKNNKYSKSFLCETIRHIQPLLFITQESINLRHFVNSNSHSSDTRPPPKKILP